MPVDNNLTESLRHRYYAIGRNWGEAQYDPAARLLRFTGFLRSWAGPEHHMTRDSLYFARILLDARNDAENARAAEIIGAVVKTQITREESPVRGNFPWAAEDAEDQVWDPNWACFNAQTLLELLNWHSTRLPGSVTAAMEASLSLCAAHDRKRWVSPAHTNIALLSALSMAAGGDWLRERKFSTAGREKLAEVAACIAPTGAFDEYNSPTYAAINLRTLASLLLFLKDEASLDLVKRLWRMHWISLLERVHAPSGQLAGPYGRAYGRDMLRHTHGIVKYQLHRALGMEFPLGVDAYGMASELFPALLLADPDAPADLIEAWKTATLPRTVTALIDSCSHGTGLPEERRFPPYWRAVAGPGRWAALIESKGAPATPGFRGRVQRITTHLAPRWCLGTVSADGQGDQTVPLIAHWPQPGRSDRADYFAALALREKDGLLEYFPGAVFCQAQHEGRVLGLLRFEPDPEDRTMPQAARACLAFQMNADAAPEIVAHGSGGTTVDFRRGVVFRANGMLAGIRVLQARVPGSAISGAIRDLAAPHAHAEGETGAHLLLEPVTLQLGQEAYVAFAVEIGEEGAGGGVPGMVQRLMTARISGDEGPDGWVRLVWGSALSLETSTRVLDCKGWLTAEGEVRATP